MTEKRQYYQCIQHYDERHIRIHRDYMMLCDFSQLKAAILWMLEKAKHEWTPITIGSFGPIAPLWELDEPMLTTAIRELVTAGYIEQHADGGTVEYRLNVRAVQQALNGLDYSTINQVFADLNMSDIEVTVE